MVCTAVLALIATILPAQAEDPSPLAATLPPPSNLSVAARSDLAVVSWTSPLASSWIVEVTPVRVRAVTRAIPTDATITVADRLEPDTTYRLRVRARDASGAESVSTPVSFTTESQPYPQAAPAVAVESSSTRSLGLSWHEVPLAAAYEVVLTGTGDPVTLTTKKPAAEFDELEPETTYVAKVRALDAADEPLSDWSPELTATTPGPHPLRVASYNVLCENCSSGKASWATRRGAVVQTITDADPDVIGVQEASQGRIPGGGSQYQDLLKRLGDPYQITDARRGASLAVRIIYNSDRVELLEKGSSFLPKGKSRRAATWAIFEQKATGQRFFFLSTHLQPTNDSKGSRKYYNVRRRQARAVVDVIERNNPDKLPVIAVGDFNSTKWEKPSNAPYDIMEDAGYADPLGNGHRTRGTAPGAFVEERIHTSYASYNMYTRKARNFPGHVNGSNPDYIFVSPMRVSEYETVVKVDSSGRWVGVIPSDHNLIRATVWLP